MKNDFIVSHKENLYLHMVPICSSRQFDLWKSGVHTTINMCYREPSSYRNRRKKDRYYIKDKYILLLIYL